MIMIEIWVIFTASLIVFETRTSCFKSSWSTPQSIIICRQGKGKKSIKRIESRRIWRFYILLSDLKLWKKFVLTRISWGRASSRDLTESTIGLTLHRLFDGAFGVKSIGESSSLQETTIRFLLKLRVYLTISKSSPLSAEETTRFDFKQPLFFPNAIVDTQLISTFPIICIKARKKINKCQALELRKS